MTTEDRLRDALHAEADQIHPRDGWTAIEARMGEAAPRSRRVLYGLAAAAAIVLVTAAAIALQDKDSAKPVLTKPGGTTTTAPTTAVPVSTRYLWPLDESTSRVFMAPDALAASFAHTFLGIANPTVGNVRPAAGGATDVDVYIPGVGASPASIITTVRAVHDDAGWHVLETTNDTLVLASPQRGDIVSSPITLRGSSVAFEGTVHVTLLGYGGDFACDQCGGTPQHPFLATTTYTGGGTEMTPFETTLSYGPTTAQYAIVMLWTDSARDGSLAAATVTWVELASAAAMPSAPACNPSDTGSGVRPALIFIGCATSHDVLTNIRWTSWTAREAHGSATHKIDDCTPDCSTGNYSTYDVDVTLSDPGNVESVVVFRTLTLSPVGVAGSSQKRTSAPCDGHPAPQQCTVPGDSWGYTPR